MSTNARIGFIAKTAGEIKHDNEVCYYQPGDYVSVYCHYDGYPTENGVGDYLRRYVHTYDEVIEIVSKGDMSSMDVQLKKILHYVEDMNESWKHNMPTKSIVIPKKMEYVYKFENDIWYVSKNGRPFVKLEHYNV